MCEGGTGNVTEYDPQSIEKKWQARWNADRAFEADVDPSKPKYYVLEMLPYPSGTMHMGHMRNYTIGDVVARFRRMLGFNVIHPMGWDAFRSAGGERRDPAGNPPARVDAHEYRIVQARHGTGSDSAMTGGREISTCEPEYYHWNQWFFLRMLERGIAYRKRSRVNWCPEVRRPYWRTSKSSMGAAGGTKIRRSKRRRSSSGSCASRNTPMNCSMRWVNSKAAGPSAF